MLSSYRKLSSFRLLFLSFRDLVGTFGLGFGICSSSGHALSMRGGSDDTLVEPLGRCVGASDHALFVCSVVAF